MAAPDAIVAPVGLKAPISDFLTQVFEATRYHANATLRGFYFTSGTQELSLIHI